RTDDESPLRRSDVSVAEKYFDVVGHREFWILSLALFVKYFLVDRVHPNTDRYWKRILRERPENLWWWSPLEVADRALACLPGIRWMAWNLVMWGRKP